MARRAAPAGAAAAGVGGTMGETAD